MNAAEHPIAPEEIMAYLDGELAPESAGRVSRHVAECAACQMVISDLQGVSRDMAMWSVGSIPDPLRAAVPRMIPEASKTAWWRRPSLRVAALLALVCLAPLLTLQRSQGPPPLNAAGGQTIVEEKSSQAALASKAPPGTSFAQRGGQVVATPMIARTASLSMIVRDFETVRQSVERIIADAGGFAGRMDVTGSRGEPRFLNATLKIPVDRLEPALVSFRSLGQVVAESQQGEDVSEQSIDLDARLANARNTEKRLNEVLQRRTGNVGDVLAAEREIARVRGEIERMEAERRMLTERVTYATVALDLREEHRAALDLGPLPVSTQLRNAIVEGFRSATSSAVNVSLFVARIAPVLLLWALVLAWPLRLFWKRG